METELKGDRETKRGLTEIITLLKKTDESEAHPEVEVDTGASEERVKRVTRFVQELGRTRATAEANVDGTAEASGEISLLKRLLNSFGRERATAHVSASGTAQTATELTLIQRIANKLDGKRIRLDVDRGALGVIGEVGDAMQDAAARIRAFNTVSATVAVPLLIAAIGGIPPVATAAGGAIYGLGSAIAQALVGGAGAGASAAGGLAIGIGLLRAAAQPTVKAFSELEQKSNELSTAENKAATASDQLSTAQDDLRSKSESHRDAREDLEEATDDLAQTQHDLNIAMRKEPLNQVDNALDLEQARINQVETTRALTEQQRSYNEALASGNESKIAEEALELRQARLDAKRATNDLKVENIDYSETSKHGSNEMATAADAHEGAIDKVADAQRKERRTAADVSAAQAKVATAMADVAKAQADVTEKSNTLTASQSRLLGVWRRVSAWAGKLFKPANDDLNDLSATTLSYVSGALPALGSTAQATVGGLAGAIARLQSALDPRQLSLFTGFLAQIPAMTEQGATGAVMLGLALANMLIAAQPQAMALLDTLATLFTNFFEWTKSVEGQTQLQTFFQRSYRYAGDVVAILRDLFLGLIGLGGAFDESGVSGKMLTGFVNLAASFREFTRAGTEGRAMIVGFGSDSIPVLDAIWAVITELVTQWFRVSSALIRARDEAGRLVVPQALYGIREALVSIGDLLISTFVRFGPLLGPIISNIALFLEQFIAFNPVLQMVTGALLWLLETFNGLDRGTKSMIVGLISARLVFAALSPIVGLLLSPLGILFGLFSTGGAAAAGVARGFGFVAKAGSLLMPALQGLAYALFPVSGAFKGIFGFVTRILGPLRFLAPLFTGLVAPALGVVAVLGALVGAGWLIYRNWGAIVAFYQTSLAPTLQMLLQWLQRVGTAFGVWLLGRARAAYEWFLENWPKFQETVLMVFRAIMRVAMPILRAVFGFFLSQGRKIVAWFTENFPLIQRVWNSVLSGVQGSTQSKLSVVLAIVQRVVSGITTFWRRNGRDIVAIVRNAWNIMKAIIDTTTTVLLKTIEFFLRVLTGDWRGAWRVLGEIVRAGARLFVTIISNLVPAMLRLFRVLGRTALQILRALWDGIVAGAKWLYNRLVGGSIIPDLVNAVVRWFKDLRKWANDIFAKMRDWLANRMREARDKVVNRVEDMKEGVLGALRDLRDSGKRIWKKFSGIIGSGLSGGINKARKWLGHLLAAAGNVLNLLGADDLGGKAKERAAKLKEPIKFAKGGIAKENRGGVLDAPVQVGGEAGIEGLVPLSRVTRGGHKAMQAAAGLYGYVKAGGAPDGEARRHRRSGEVAKPGGVPGGTWGRSNTPISEMRRSSGYAVGMGPTRWGWEPHVEKAINHVMSLVSGVTRNTYVDHPPSPHGQWHSVDYWGSGGRGDPINQGTGDKIVSTYMSRFKDQLDYIIWRSQINSGGGWQAHTGPYNHEDHPHVTLLRKGGSNGGFSGGSGPGGGGGVIDWLGKITSALSSVGAMPNLGMGIVGEGVQDASTNWLQIAKDFLVEKAKEFGGGLLGRLFGGKDNLRDEAGKSERAKWLAKRADAAGVHPLLPTMTSLVESDMQTGPSVRFKDADSAGPYQVRVNLHGWSVDQAEDWAYSTDNWFLKNARRYIGEYGDSASELGAWAQRVQGSAYPTRYAGRYDQAKRLAGYLNGGLVGLPSGKPGIAMVHGQERVLTERQNNNFERMVETTERSPHLTGSFASPSVQVNNDLRGLTINQSDMTAEEVEAMVERASNAGVNEALGRKIPGARRSVSGSRR